MKPIKYKDLERILRSKGCVIDRQDGSHIIWRCGRCLAPVPKHRDVSAGVLRSVERMLEPCLGKGWLHR